MDKSISAGRQEIEDHKLLQSLGDGNFQNRDDADDHEGAATAFFDTSEASRNIYPWSCPWMQHTECVSHLPTVKSPATKMSVKSGEIRSSGSSLSQILISLSSYAFASQ